MEKHRLSRHVFARAPQSTVFVSENHRNALSNFTLNSIHAKSPHDNSLFSGEISTSDYESIQSVQSCQIQSESFTESFCTESSIMDPSSINDVEMAESGVPSQSLKKSLRKFSKFHTNF